MSIWFLLCCILFVVCRSSVTSEEEPMCTKFMYDKQMIETMVRMEVKMEQWDKERKEFEGHQKEKLDEVVRAQNDKLETMIADFNNVRSDVRNTKSDIEKVAGTIKATPKVAFNAYTTADGSYPVNKVLVFPNILLNEGGGYNKITGVFTAPISGLYNFNAHVCQPAGNYMVVSIVQGSRQLAKTTVYENNASSCSSVSAPAQVNKGEIVFIKSTFSDSRLHSDSLYRWPSFSGFLVNE